MVPLFLQSADESITDWESLRNFTFNSCLAISFHFAPEKKGRILNELRNIKKQIKRLRAGKITISDTVYDVEYELMCTMIDEKLCQVIINTSASSNCNVILKKE